MFKLLSRSIKKQFLFFIFIPILLLVVSFLVKYYSEVKYQLVHSFESHVIQLVNTVGTSIQNDVRYKKYYELSDTILDLYNSNKNAHDNHTNEHSTFNVVYISLVDADDNILAHSNPRENRILSKDLKSKINKSIFVQEVGEVQHVWNDNYSMIHLKRDIYFGEENLATIYVNIIPTYLIKSLENLISKITILFIVLILFTIFFLVMFKKRIEKPINEIINELKNMGSGQISLSFSKRDDELSTIAMLITEADKNIFKNREAMQLSSKVFSTMTDGVLITDSNQIILKVNGSFCKLTGYDEKDILGKKPSLLSSGWHDKEFYKQMWADIHEKGAWQGEIVDRKKNGEIYVSDTSIIAVKNNQNIVANYIAISSDITYKKEQEKIINNMAYYDALTKLPNKVLFEERLNDHIAMAKRQKSKIALLFIDLDNFKNINDTLGHLVGDTFLKDAALRMKRILREEDTIGRFGGDEFAILVHDFESLSSIGTLAEKIVNIFKKPFSLNNTDIYSGASIGISIYPDDAENYEEMVRLADTAMYHIKNSGKNNYEFFSESMNKSIAKKMKISNALYNALENNEFYLTYQPKVNINTKTIYGMEALIRWVHPKLGFIGPDKFINIAEENGQIYDIGLWVIRQALSDTKKLHDMGYDNLTISINVSSKQLERSDFLSDFRAVIDEVGLKREFIDLEITESQVMSNIESSLKILNEIAKCGISMSIDDFGTGYSSLSYLKKLPAKTIKIDKSFVLDIDKDEEDRAIVTSIIALSKSLNKSVIAEGSETQEHIDMLRELGISHVQGYFYSKPIIFTEFKKFLKEF